MSDEKVPIEGCIMMAAAFAMALVNAIGEYTSAEGVSALGDLGASTATVIRGGNRVEVPSANLVPGDIVEVEIGQTIPADMRVLVSTDLSCEESVLTGEPEPVVKHCEPVEDKDEPFPANMAYSSTGVVQGKGICVVIATGMEAQVGLIAKRLDVGGCGLSPLQKLMNRAGGFAGVMVFVLMIVITLAGYFTRYQDPSHACREDDNRCFFSRSATRGILIGIACVPSTLPAMMTMMLLSARYEITKKQAQVRKTSSVETLGTRTLGFCVGLCIGCMQHLAAPSVHPRVIHVRRKRLLERRFGATSPSF